MTLAMAGTTVYGYPVNKSLRFRSSASANLKKTFATTRTSTTTCTISMWVKRGILSSAVILIYGYDGTSVAASSINFNADDTMTIKIGGTAQNDCITSQVFRDVSSWYHIVLAIDTTQATASNRYKLYINGSQVTSFGTANYPPQNSPHYFMYTGPINGIGYNANGNSQYFDGYIAEVNVIDGQALTPSSFGAFSGPGGVWQPIKYTGTYGNSGYYLKFTDTTSTATLGTDYSGNGQTWTVNNISLTAGATYDSMTDSPTSISSTVGNYAVGNRLFTGGGTWTNGNLTFSVGNNLNAQGTIGVTSGKWYWEMSFTAVAAATGVQQINQTARRTNGVTYSTDGTKYVNGVNSAYGAAYTTNDVIGVALDMDGGTVTFYKNNVSQGSISLSGVGITTATFTIDGGATSAGWINFGQRPLTYTPPSGYVALNTYNLTAPTIVQSNKYFDSTLWTGNGTSLTVTNAGGFQPDFVWGKSRNGVFSNYQYDTIRGATNYLRSDSTDAQATSAGGLTSFNSNGFSLGAGTGLNNATTTYVGWQWSAGQNTTTVNTNGTITSNVSVNTSSGFSIVSYTGTGAVATVGHGLGVTPQFIIFKNRTSVTNWSVYHVSTGNTGVTLLNTADAFTVSAAQFNNTSPTSSVITVGTGNNVNQNTNAIVAYCWTPIAGFSAFGSYTGNGSIDGNFIYTGFKPKFVIIKRYDTTANWVNTDGRINPYNVTTEYGYPGLTTADATGAVIMDFVSNGFKLRCDPAVYTAFNASGGTYIYMAWAENPFKYALAR